MYLSGSQGDTGNNNRLLTTLGNRINSVIQQTVLISVFKTRGYKNYIHNGKIQRRSCQSPREEYLSCGPSCPAECNSGESLDYPCPDDCHPGCFCKKPFVRGLTGQCIWRNNCPPVSSRPTLPLTKTVWLTLA